MEILKLDQESESEFEEIPVIKNSDAVLQREDLTEKIGDASDSADVEKQQALADYIERSLRDSKTGVAEKNKVLQCVFRYLTHAYEEEYYNPQFHSKLEKVLERYYSEGDNFFLKQIIKVFIKREEYPISSEEKRDSIKYSWEKSIGESASGESYYVTDGSGIYEFNRFVASPDDLTDDEVNAIYKMLLNEDLAYSAPETLYEFAAAGRYRDKNIEDHYTVADVASAYFQYPNDAMGIYNYEDYLDKVFFSKIDSTMGGFYEKGELKSVFHLNKEKSRDYQGKIRGFNDIKSIARLIAGIDQASLGFVYNLKAMDQEMESLKSILPEEILNSITDITQQYFDKDSESLRFDPELKWSATEIKESLKNFLFENMPDVEKAEEPQLPQLLSGFNQEENPEDFAKLYQAMMSTRMRTFLEDYFHVSLADFSLNTQAQFLRFVSHASEAKIAKVKDFLNQGNNQKAKTERFTTFLSLEYGQDMGEKILKIAEILGEESARAIFAKYSEIVNASENILDYLKEQYGGDKGYHAELIREIQEKMLDKGRDILASFADEAAEKRERGEEISHEEVLSRLNNVKLDTLLFLSSFKAIKRSGAEINLEDVKDVAFAQSKPSLISEEHKKRMWEIYMHNYANTPEFMNLILEKFDESLKNDNNTFHLLLHKGAVRGFYRMEEKAKEHLYFSAFNIDPEYRGSALGETMLEQSLDYYGASELYTIEATCTQEARISANYIERGFIAAALDRVKEINSLHIFWNESMNHLLFKSKRFGKNEIMNMAEVGTVKEYDDGRIIVASRDAVEIQKIPFWMINHPENGSQYVMTRYFREANKDNKEIAYVVFEKISDAHLKTYKEHDAPDLKEKFPAGPREDEDYFIV